MNRKIIPFLLAMSLASPALAMEDGIYRDKAPGYGGDVIVTAIVRNGQLTEITTENTGGEKSEYYLKAEKALTTLILERQGIDGVDAVAGATGTSESILSAMKGILEQTAYTGTLPDALNQAAEEVKEGVTETAQKVKTVVDSAPPQP